MGQGGSAIAERSALLEAIEQLTRALDQIATLPGTPALRREQITLQIALLNPLQYVKGYGALEAKAAVERARLLIEQAEALGEPPEDPLLLLSVLSAFWVTNWGTFNADALRELAAQYLALAEKQGATVPVLTGHYRIGLSLMSTGDIAQGRARFDHAIALYDPAEHRPLAMQFGHDMGVIILCWRSLALWMLGYPEGALADAEHALRDARATNHAATLMNALGLTAITHILCGNSAAAKALSDELIALADEKGSLFWKPIGMKGQGWVLALTGRASDGVKINTAALNAWRSTGATLCVPVWLSTLARTYAELGQFDDAWRCIDEALTTTETTNERWYEAYTHHIAGEIALMSPEPDAAKAQAHFESALAVARKQQAKSWELRAAMSMARL